MKLRILPLAALLSTLACTGTLLAQQESSVPGEHTAPVSLSMLAPLDFGAVTRGSESTIASTSGYAAEVQVSGDELSAVTIVLPSTIVLTTTSGRGASMTVSVDRSTLRIHNRDRQNEASVLDASTGWATSSLSSDAGGDGGGADGLGQSYIWIGGSLVPAANQPRGLYTGTLTISAVYAN